MSWSELCSETPGHGSGIAAEKHTFCFFLSPLHMPGVNIGDFYNCKVNDTLLKEVFGILEEPEPYGCLPVPKGDLQEKWRETFGKGKWL